MLPLRQGELYRRGLCETCYNRGRRSRARFGGGREKVVARDHYLCRVCLAPAPLVELVLQPNNILCWALKRATHKDLLGA